VHGHRVVATIAVEREFHVTVCLGTSPHKRALGQIDAPK
jgi:hypothetical protein